MKKKVKVLVALVVTMCMFTACAQQVDTPIIRDIESEPLVESVPASGSVEKPETEPAAEPEAVPANSYRSELTNEWIDNSLKEQRPIAVMVDNEKTALPHFGLTEADVVYEIMNSTANDRVTRFMAIVKDWGSITQFGSIRSTRPTNFMLAVEWNAVICHDGGPFYINDWVAKEYTNNLSGGFARFSNGKATEFTEYLTYDTYTNPTTGKSYDGLKQRFAKSKYSTTYNEYYQGAHFKFAEGGVDLASRSDAVSASTIKLPFTHNQSTLKYNEETKTYDYYEYGKAHVDPVHDNAPLTFTNVILQDTTFEQLDENGYMIYNAVDASGRSGYYITEGKAIEITWSKPTETALTVFYDKATGQEIELNTGKTYISLIPSDTWKDVVIQ
ncbi:MAG: DUF3048 domain-containing protein [Lachnoclostridium sp.]|nr:DUF3048 domain-containing protein [Lachnospira sp.]MCM1248591.1 DUF3048 domain-containing protein [Lachnoclostridium sp.]